MSVTVVLLGIAALLGTAILGAPLQRWRPAGPLIYAPCLAVCLGILAVAGHDLIGGSVPASGRR